MDTKEKHRRKNPVETANFLSLLFFGWTMPIFWKGSKRDLLLTDLYDPLKSNESERLGDRLEREWNKELIRASGVVKNEKKDPSKKPNLIWAIIRMFWVPYMVTGLLVFFQTTVLYAIQPILQGLIISYFDPGQNQITKNQVLLYAGCLVIVALAVSMIIQHMILRNRQIGMCIRIACCSLIYRKILRLDQAAVNNTATGQVANLISNDVARFDDIPIYLHYLWIMPIQVSLLGYMMWRTIGVSALIGIGALILQSISVQGYISSFSGKLRAKIASQTDKRVQLMSELISGIQVVKMHSWEKPFELIVSKVRALEMKYISYMSYLRGFDLSMVVLTRRISLFFTLISFVLMGNQLNAEITFILEGLFTVLHETCNICFPEAIILAGEASVSIKRITEFLLLEEVQNQKKVQFTGKKMHRDIEKAKTKQEIHHRVGIDMFKVTANWVSDQLQPTLSEISLKIRNQSLCALTGPVGSGKSSLLHLVLGELPVQNGKLSLFIDEAGKTHQVSSQDIRISYASQDPWLFSATIRDNILFGQPYAETRYQEVTRVCALLKDFEQLPQGDLSFVGERGAILSGGQKARVNLARAVYRDADLYLLDDPLSAVDPRVGRHLFEECIAGFLKDKTRILVTHQLQYLRQADTVVVLDHGTVKCQGTYDELVGEKAHILDSGVLEEIKKVQCTEKNQEEQSEFKSAVITREDGDQQQKITDNEETSDDMNEEEVASGNISKTVYREYFSAGGNICSLVLLAVIFTAGQIMVSGTDYWVTDWANQETLKATLQSDKLLASNTSCRNKTGDGYQGMNYTESYWLDEYGRPRQSFEIYVYTACIIGSTLIIILRSTLLTRMCMNASRKMHNTMFANLLLSTMRFFNTNPTGRILNRFTKDMGAMDEHLPKVMLETLQIMMLMFGSLILVVIANNWMILPTVVLCGIFYIARIYYLKTAQDIKRLEGITKSPMFSHANSTLDGLPTIRSRGALAAGLLKKEFDRHQDGHTAAWYLNIVTTGAFGLTLELITCCFIASICFSFILMDAGDTLGGFVGMAISQSLILISSVEYGIRQSAEFISQMTSVERIAQYTKLPKEGPFTTDNPPPSTWPSEGSLTFKNVSMKYAENEPPVLKNLNLTINPGWKIGIVGRTGAGKSSLISALVRLAGDGLEGEILLDEIDTKSIGLHELRPRISIIPQEPILFSASLRYNLDPFEEYSDAELWSSLREVELGNVVSSLDFQVTGGGSNFSVGQRQLICLARAILRNNRILVLDEATANVDHGTDALIQNTIRQKFADCTVLTIAHRLNTIMDSDRVLVMSDGCIAEFDQPHLLLENPDGLLSRMLQETGKASAARLAKIAESCFLLSSRFGEESTEQTTPLLLNDQITHL